MILPDFWLAGRLITAVAVFVEFVDFVDDADFTVLVDFAESDKFDLSDLFDKALEGFEDWALLARLLLAEVSEPEVSFSESLILYIGKWGL